MVLKRYQAKRSFKKTSEPSGTSKKKNLWRFVVQKHQASNLHYDFRLELPEEIVKGNIVLKSWAVPKGVPQDFGIKHLAVLVEDHPVEYIDFSGTIPKGEYGAGKVEIWDKGNFLLLDVGEKSLKFELNGKKLQGNYVLFKLKKKNWLIFKSQK